MPAATEFGQAGTKGDGSLMLMKLRTTAHCLPLLLLATLLAGCSFVRTGFDKRPVAPDVNHPRIEIPASDSQLNTHVPHQVAIGLEHGVSPEMVAAELGAEVADFIPALNAALLRLPEDMPVVEALRRLQDRPGVRYVEPNYVTQAVPEVYDGLQGAAQPYWDDGVLPLAASPAGHPPINPRQWGLYTIGAPLAWQYSTGAGTVIAVIDSGLDWGHPDLGDKILGGVSLVPGYDPNNWYDDDGHGTHVAGIAAAAGRAPGGVVGVAYDSRLLGIKVLDRQGRGTVFSIAEGIWAVVDWRKYNASPPTVINLSLGGLIYSILLKDVLDYALAEGIPVVAAMGNDARGLAKYPAAYPGVIAVGAVTPDLRPTYFSTSWKHISVSAPGMDIYSSVPGGYGTASGTSMAAPFVSGAAALLLAREPGLSPGEVRSRLETFARHPDGPGRWDEQVGHGVINVAASLLGDRDLANFYGSVEVELRDHSGQRLNTVNYGTSPRYQLDFFVDVYLDHPVRTDIGPVMANDEGMAVFAHVPVDSGYTAVATVWWPETGFATSKSVALPDAVRPGQTQRVIIQLDLR